MTDTLHDASKRMHETIATEIADNRRAKVGKWMAFALDDGRCDGTLYDTWKDATKHTAWPAVFVRLQPDGMTHKTAILLLRFHRDLHESGIRTGDPETPQPVLTHRQQKTSLLLPPWLTG